MKGLGTQAKGEVDQAFCGVGEEKGEGTREREGEGGGGVAAQHS